jgi:hypothetical protein
MIVYGGAVCLRDALIDPHYRQIVRRWHFRSHSVRRILISVGAVVAVACSNDVVPTPVMLAAPNTPASFADLFGIEASRAKTDLPAELRRCLEMAHEDFNLALSGKPLRNAAIESAAPADGGTTIWHGPCYSLTVYRQIAHICTGTQVISGLIVGPELRLHPNGEFPERAVISRTRFMILQDGSTPDPAIVCDTEKNF